METYKQLNNTNKHNTMVKLQTVLSLQNHVSHYYHISFSKTAFYRSNLNFAHTWIDPIITSKNISHIDENTQGYTK